MSKPRHRAILEGTLLAITIIFLVMGLGALGLWPDVPFETRAVIFIGSSLGLLACFTGLLYTGKFWKWLRRRTWRRVMAAWQEHSPPGDAGNYVSAGRLSEGGLKRLAIQIYSRMGYLVVDREDADYIQLINPHSQIELVACRQCPDLIELHYVHSLQLEMKRIKAVRGFFWAPAGFTGETLQWVAHRPICLADQQEIGRLVDCAYSQGSRLLEYA